MINTIQTHEDLLQSFIDYKVPTDISCDVLHRILCWIESGGCMTDNYIKQQYIYVEKYISMKGE